MRIAREGYRIIMIPALLTVIAIVMGWTWAVILFGLATVAVTAFFRDPDRAAPAGPGLILAPADGKIVEIREVDDLVAGRQTRLSIFMSPLDVHVNRAPVAGRVETVEY